MACLESELQGQQKQAAAVLLGNIYTQAALQKASADKGQGFTVYSDDVEKWLGIERYSNHHEKFAAKKSLHNQLLSGVPKSMLEESESLHRFARSYGYSIEVVRTIDCDDSIFEFFVRFKRALG